MKNRVKTGKRDIEKKKQQKREEKQKRKQERANAGTRSFDDMIAYVDENGMLHSTPPEKSKVEVDLENIAVSTPKQEDIVEEPNQGRVEFFNEEKGFGFIKNLNNADKYFFHISSAPQNIAIGNKVTFEVERGARGLVAVRISII